MNDAATPAAPLRVAIAGLGIAGESHLFDAMANPSITVVGVCAQGSAKARATAERYGVPTVYHDLEELLETERPDAVAVATPPRYLAAHAIRALGVGAHVLLEKPAAATPGDVERLLLASCRPQRCIVAYTRRYKRGWHRVRALLADGALGTPQHVRLTWRGPYRTRYSNRAESYRSSAASRVAGVVLDTGSHMIDLCHFLLAPTEHVSVARVELSSDGVDVSASWRAHLRDQIVVDATITDSCESEHAEVLISGAHRSLLVRESADRVAISMGAQAVTEHGYLRRPIDDLVALHTAGDACGASVEDARLVSEQVFAIYRAAGTEFCRDRPWTPPSARGRGRLSGAC